MSFYEKFAQEKQYSQDLKDCIETNEDDIDLINELKFKKEKLEQSITDKNDISNIDNRELDYERKLYLIENCIFGIDIQPIAVQISKLRFFISLITDQKIDVTKKNFGINPLPNLETKFVAANTLIGINKGKEKEQVSISFENPEITKKKNELKKVREKHFGARTPKTKTKYREKDKKLRQEIADLLKNENNSLSEDETIKLASWNPYDQNVSSDFFDMEWMFGIHDGFDVVIGNPPYIGEKGNKELFHIIKNTPFGKLFYQRRMDYFYFFISKGIILLKSKGLLSFITTNYWVTASGAESLRSFLREEVNILKYLDFGEFRVFESVQGQHNSIFLLEKNKYGKDSKSKVTQIISDEDIFDFDSIFNFNKEVFFAKKFISKEQKYLYSSSTYNINFLDNNLGSVLEKIKNKPNTLLGNLCYVSGGISSSADKVRDANIKHCTTIEIEFNNIKLGNGIFILNKNELESLFLDENEKEFIKPYFKSSEINKWITNNIPNKFLIYATHINAHNIENKKNLFNHFKKFESILKNRSQDIELETAMKKGHWFVLTNGRPKIDFNIEKIVCPYRSKEVFFAYNNLTWFAGRDVYFMVNFRISSKYILSILNSKVISFWLKNKGKMKGDIFEMYPEPLKEIPIVISDNLNIFIILVDEIMEKKKLEQNTQELEDKIDLMVYKLYELTYDEVKIVDPEFKLSESEYISFV